MHFTENRFLAHLPDDTIGRFSPMFEHINLEAGDVPIRDPVEHVYFPLQGLVSFVISSETGNSSEVAIAGKEGLVGLCVFLNSKEPLIPGIVRRPGEAIRLPAKTALDEFRMGGDFQVLVLSYLRVFFKQVAQTSLCNAQHSLEQRLCRWLLMSHDRLDPDDHVAMTQETIAHMLGVRREAVTRVAQQLKSRQIIDYGTRRIEVLDREGLIDASCECYAILKDEYDRFYQ